MTTEQQPKRKRQSRKKSHAFNVLSQVKCRRCGRFIKLRLVENKQTAELCYKCWKMNEKAKGHVVK